MLPFTTISFVKDSGCQVSSAVKVSSSSDADPLNFQDGCSSGEFYSSVISEPSSQSFCKQPQQKQHNPKTISQNSFTKLYDSVCNDDLESVKEWFAIHIPAYNKPSRSGELPANVISGFSDTFGCNIAMSAAVHKSYESMKFLLHFFPSLAEGVDTFGNTFYDVAESMNDEHLHKIVAKFAATPQHIGSKTDHGSVQEDSYCSVCNIKHSDPDHDSSITHLFAESRSVPEINPHLDPSNVGYKMMSKLGWSENKGLGPSEDGRKYLIKTHLKTDRRGLGIPEENNPKVTHFLPNDVSSIDNNLVHKRKISLKTENKRKRKKDAEKSRQWEIDLRRSMNEYE